MKNMHPLLKNSIISFFLLVFISGVFNIQSDYVCFSLPIMMIAYHYGVKALNDKKNSIAEEKYISILSPYVNEHLEALSRKKYQTFSIGEYGNPVDGKWNLETEIFYKKVVEPNINEHYLFADHSKNHKFVDNKVTEYIKYNWGEVEFKSESDEIKFEEQLKNIPTNCANCGAQISITAYAKQIKKVCEYCGSLIRF